MSEKDLRMKSALEALIGASKRGVIIVDGTISDVSETSYTCTVSVGKAQFFKVPLRVLINSKASICEIPANGSTCLMTFRDGNIQRPQIFSIDKCEKILLTCDDIEMNGTMIKLNGLNIASMVNVINGNPIPEPGNGANSAFQTALKNALNA